MLAPAAALAAADPYRPQQWALDRIAAPAAWSTSQGRGVVVAVVDSGVDLTHPDLAPRLLRDGDGRVVGRDLVDGDERPQDRHGHGTMVAGVIAAATDNGVGVAGTAPRARLMPVRVLDEQGRGTAADVDAAIRWAVDQGADVVNLSLESDAVADEGARPQAPAAAVRYAWDQGAVVVAAAGNSGNPFTDYPSDSPVLIVGATTRDDRVAPFSDSGRRDAVVAPGMGIVSTWCREGDRVCDGTTHTYGQADGTSFAAPYVSGGVALLRSRGLDHEEAVRRLRETARDVPPRGRDRESGHGLIDLAAAVREPKPEPSGSPATASPSTGATASGEMTPTSPPDPSAAPTDEVAGTPTPSASHMTGSAPSAPATGPSSGGPPGWLEAATSLLVVATAGLWFRVRRRWVG